MQGGTKGNDTPVQ